MLRWWPVLSALTLAACSLPRDPEESMERVQSTHELRVGATDNPPWINAGTEQPAGIEADLIRRFARQNGAQVRWTRGSETMLAEALRKHELDIAIGGFDAKTKWASVAGVSQPFAETADKKKHVMLTAAGENRLTLALDRFLTESLRISKAQTP